MNEKLTIRDLAHIGVFLVIYYVLIGLMSMTFVLLGMGATDPFLAWLCFGGAPFMTGVVAGPVVMLLMTKVQKAWGFFIFGMLSPLALWATGHTWIVPAISVFFVGLAEFILRKGHFKSLKAMTLAYACFNIWAMTPFFAVLWIQFMQTRMVEKMGKNLVMTIFTFPHMLGIVGVAFVGGLIGAFLGRKMINKHFHKAGIV